MPGKPQWTDETWSLTGERSMETALLPDVQLFMSAWLQAQPFTCSLTLSSLSSLMREVKHYPHLTGVETEAQKG